MTNYEWLIKNWDKKVQTFDKTVGDLFTSKISCFFISKCSKSYNCSSCFLEWLDSEATKDNNFYFDDVQKD